jgi:hypothetical protein
LRPSSSAPAIDAHAPEVLMPDAGPHAFSAGSKKRLYSIATSPRTLMSASVLKSASAKPSETRVCSTRHRLTRGHE